MTDILDKLDTLNQELTIIDSGKALMSQDADIPRIGVKKANTKLNHVELICSRLGCFRSVPPFRVIIKGIPEVTGFADAGDRVLKNRNVF